MLLDASRFSGPPLVDAEHLVPLLIELVLPVESHKEIGRDNHGN